MSSIVSSVSDLISSIFEVFRSIFATIISALDSVLAVFTNLVRSVFDLMSGLVGFVLGNIVIIGVIIAAYVGYTAYKQKNQGGGISKKRS
ncbi:hypothetical protein MMC22_003369 [Lobaria immixta]|nr:hypothetical protein [Lobaria immixta]